MPSSSPQIVQVHKAVGEYWASSRQFGIHVGMNASPDYMNRRLRKLDQCFIKPSMGLAQTEPDKRHILFSLSDDDTYSASLMATVNKKVPHSTKSII
jgi:hypothetical protein